MNKIKYTCSFGPFYHSNQILNRLNIKSGSYPFDLIYTTKDNILDCIKDNFRLFLDKSNYIDNNDKQVDYHNTLRRKCDYNYYINCVNEFKDLIKSNDYKLFIITLLNKKENIYNEIKHEMVKFERELRYYIKNYKILVILHIGKRLNQDHIFIFKENIDFLELYTREESDGKEFKDEEDNKYLDKIIQTNYKFDIKR